MENDEISADFALVIKFLLRLTNSGDKVKQELSSMRRGAREVSLSQIPESVFISLQRLIRIPAIELLIMYAPEINRASDLDRPYHILYEIIQKAVRDVSHGHDTKLLTRVRALSEQREYHPIHRDFSRPFPVDMRDVTQERIEMSTIFLADTIESRLASLPAELHRDTRRVVSFLRALAVTELRASVHKIEGFSDAEVSFVETFNERIRDIEQFNLSQFPHSIVESLSRIGYIDHVIHLALLGHGQGQEKPLLYDAQGGEITTLDYLHAFNPLSLAMQQTMRRDEQGDALFSELMRLEKLSMTSNGHDMIEVATASDEGDLMRLLGETEVKSLWLQKAMGAVGSRVRNLFYSRDKRLGLVREKDRNKMKKECELALNVAHVGLLNFTTDEEKGKKQRIKTAFDAVKKLLNNMSEGDEILPEYPKLMRAAIEVLSHPRMAEIDEELADFVRQYATIYEKGAHSFVKDEVKKLSDEKRIERVVGDLRQIVESYNHIRILQDIGENKNFFDVCEDLRMFVYSQDVNVQGWDYKSYQYVISLLQKYGKLVDSAHVDVTEFDVLIKSGSTPVDTGWYVHENEKRRVCEGLIKVIEQVKKKWQDLYFYPDRLASVEQKRLYRVSQNIDYPLRGEKIIDMQVLPDGRVVSLVGDGEEGRHQMLYGLEKEPINITQKLVKELKKEKSQKVDAIKISHMSLSPNGDMVFLFFIKGKIHQEFNLSNWESDIFAVVDKDFKIKKKMEKKDKELQIDEIRWCPDDKFLVIGNRNGVLQVFDSGVSLHGEKNEFRQRVSQGTYARVIKYEGFKEGVTEVVVSFDQYKNDMTISPRHDVEKVGSIAISGNHFFIIKCSEQQQRGSMQIIDFDILSTSDPGEFVFASKEGVFVTEGPSNMHKLDLKKVYEPEDENTNIIQMQAVGDKILC